jgi:hypothetical protein
MDPFDEVTDPMALIGVVSRPVRQMRPPGRNTKICGRTGHGPGVSARLGGASNLFARQSIILLTSRLVELQLHSALT